MDFGADVGVLLATHQETVGIEPLTTEPPASIMNNICGNLWGSYAH